MKRFDKYLEGARDGVPIGLGYVSVAFAFGMLASSEGLTVWQAVLISLTNVTSAGQLAGLNLMTACASVGEIALTQLVINMRYALMSLSLSQKLDSSMTTPHRLTTSFCLTDEVFAVASAKAGDIGRQYMYGLTLAPYFGWALGTLLGAAAGTVMPEALRAALGIAIYGMFLAIIIPPARDIKPVRAAVAFAVALSCAFRYIPLFSGLSSGFALIISAVAASAACALIFPIREASDDA